VLAGGTTNPDRLRRDQDAVALVKAFADAGKPVASDDLPAFTQAAIAAFS